MKQRFAALALLLLAACTPAALPVEPTPLRITALPTPTVDPGESLDPGATSTTTGQGESPTVELSWDPSPDTIVIDGTFCCGFTSREMVRNALPEFRIWGDGRYIWTEHDDEGGRALFEGRLSVEEMGAVLDDAQVAGFFSWKDRYANDGIADVADQCITIRLSPATKQVCEYYEGAPAAFHSLFDELSSGAGASGLPYVPERGFVQFTVFPADFVTPDLQWTDPTLSLARTAGSGVWVEGSLLEPLWNALNRRPWGPVAEENGVFYMFTIQIEGLSLFYEPTP